MTWNKKLIDIENIDSFCNECEKMAKAGNELLERIHCVFSLNDDSIIYTFPVFTFLEMYSDKKFTKESINKFYIYTSTI